MPFTLLWIEDDPNDILLGERALLKSGFSRPLVVRDGEEAIEYLSGAGQFQDRSRSPLPSLVLSDLKLPRVSGHEVLRWLRQQDGLRRIPFIVFTSSRQKHDIEQAYDLGANAYLVKPIETQALTEVFTCLNRFWMACNTSTEIGPK